MIFITFCSEPPPKKKCIFPFEKPETFKKFQIIGVGHVKHSAQNADHTTQDDGRTMQNVKSTMRNVGHNTLNVCQGPQSPPLPPT